MFPDPRVDQVSVDGLSRLIGDDLRLALLRDGDVRVLWLASELIGDASQGRREWSLVELGDDADLAGLEEAADASDRVQRLLPSLVDGLGPVDLQAGVARVDDAGHVARVDGHRLAHDVAEVIDEALFRLVLRQPADVHPTHGHAAGHLALAHSVVHSVEDPAEAEENKESPDKQGPAAALVARLYSLLFRSCRHDGAPS